jgi:Spy/CpxP family protein refolding chaperone
MNILTSKRLVTTAFVLLALLNVTLLGMLWWQNSNRLFPGHMARNHHNREFSFTRQLALSESQTVSFGKLRKEHFLKIEPEIQAIGLLKKQLIEEALKDSADTKKIEVIAENIGSHQAAVERDLALHFHELAKVCTPEQRDSLKIVLERIATRKHHNDKGQ